MFLKELNQPYNGGYLGAVIVNKEDLSAKIEWFNNIGHKIIGCDAKSCQAECCHYIIPLTFDECENFAKGFTFEKRFGKYCLSKKENDDACSLLSKKNKCKDYNNRPLICKIYPFSLDPISHDEFIVYWIDRPDKCGAKIIQEKSETLDQDLIKIAVNETKDELRRFTNPVLSSKA